MNSPSVLNSDLAQVPQFAPASVIATILSLHPKTIAQWAAAGRIARFKVNGKTILYEVNEIIAYVRSCRIFVVRSALC